MDAPELEAQGFPAGDYAIVELLGHRRLVGRVVEVTRFGTSLLQIEPICAGQLLGPVLLGGGSIYQFTPVSDAVAFQRAPRNAYELPASVVAAAGLDQPPALPSWILQDEDEPVAHWEDADVG